MTALAKYLAVGIANTLTTLLIIFLLMAAGLEVLAANLIGYMVGVALSYTLNRWWTFRSALPVRESLPRFLIVVAVAYAANFLVVWCAHYLLSVDGYIAQIAGMPVYIAVGFLGSRLFAFKSANPR